MDVLAFLCLRVLHWLYALTALVSSFVRHFRRKPPKPLKAQRGKLPTHLAVVLHSEPNHQTEETERIYLESVKTAIACCRTLGVKRLTVYDYHGVLLSCMKKFNGVGEWNSLTAAEPLSIHIISRDAGKPYIASTAHSLYNAHRLKTHKKSPQDTSENPEFKISSSELGSILEDKLPSPDLMIIHSIDPSKAVPEPLELHGYPPWQVRLTELYNSDWLSMPWNSKRLVALDELKVRAALDEFAQAEMRLGK